MSLAFFVQLLIGRHVDDGRIFSGIQVLWRTIAVGILASLGTAVLPLPATIGRSLSGSDTVSGVIYAAELLLVAAVAVPTLITQWRRLRRDDAPPPGVESSSPVILGYAAIYLAVMAMLWVTALPAYFGAVNGLTSHGDPVGSLWYATACLIIAAVCLTAAGTVIARRARAVIAASDRPNHALTQGI
jgi:hypothetical protein